MLKEPRAIRQVARDIADAADGALDAYHEGRTLEEPQITDRILGAIEERLRTAPSRGILWKARTLRTGRGSAAEERRHGADLLGVLDIEMPRYKTKKGFLAQAKKAEPGTLFAQHEWRRLVAQCELMLKRTPDSFVFAYSRKRGIRIFPANAVVSANTRDLFDLYDKSMGNFFQNHIQSFIGDKRLDSTDIATLDVLADLPIARVFELSGRGEG